MEVLQDTYKDTKIGRIPKDWEVINLIDSTENGISNGVFNDPKKVGKGYKLVNVVNMYKGNSIQIKDLTLLDLNINEFEKNKVKYGDILFTRSSLVESGIAYSNINLSEDNDITYDGHLMKISPNKELTNVIFLSYFFRGHTSRKQFIARGKTTTMTTIGQKDIASVKIAIPPLPEQQKIADILSTVDEQISTTDKIIEKSKELKKGLMQKLFSEGIGHTEFKDTKIGRIPENWEVIKLSEVVDILNNKRKPLNSSQRNSIPGDVPYYGANGQVDSINDFIFNEPLILMAEDGGNFSEYEFRHIAYKITGKSWVNNHAHVLKPKSDFDFDYVFYELEHKNILRFINGSTRTKLNQGDLKGIPLKIPPLPEQQKIAEILSEADAKIEKEQTQKAQLEALKKGLMQQLLTGKKRVTV
jgi:type I restriction enzyme, S subunit